MEFNYQTICHANLLKELSGRQKDIIVRRFGLKGEPETLESIGRTFGVTRERVRQIEEDGLKKLEERLAGPVCRDVFQYFAGYLKDRGLLKREDVLLEELGGRRFKNHVFFLLTLGKDFERFGETEDFYPFWTIDKNSFNVARRAVSFFISALQKKNQPLLLPAGVMVSHVEISKNILKGPGGLYGLKSWPEINPRGVKDKAYIVLKQERTPLHFSRVASLINASNIFKLEKSVVCQTVHNELIKDPRFVLVGRGTYALREWGYEPGVAREVIWRVITASRHPLATGEIVEKVLKQRQIKPNTILLNLQNKKYFIKNSEGKYTIREV